MTTTDETTTTVAADVESTTATPAVTAAFDPSTGEELAHWDGVLVVEGVTTGDGREFAADSLTWAALPIPLRWNKEDSHGGEPHTVAVNVGRIDKVWRVKNKIMGAGVFNLGEEDGQRAYDLVKGEFLKGVSVDVDDVTDADVELVWPEDGAGEDDEAAEKDIFDSLFAQPEKVIFHKGRIRAATLCDIPAFVDAQVRIVDSVTAAATLEMLSHRGPVATHETATSDEAWTAAGLDGAPREAFAWTDEDADPEHFHHHLDEAGQVGAANVTACAAAIGVLNGARGGTDLSDADREAAYAHLAAHLRDAGREPPELISSPESVTAGATLDLTDAPPRAWFADPHLTVPTPITVLDDGRVYGHAATWGQCHVGAADVCVTPPHEDFHAYFMTGELVTDDGERVSVGQLVSATRHAGLQAGARGATEHYENTGYVVADVTTGNDAHGIWVAGAVRPWADQAQVRALRGSGQLSGDWRRIGGKLRLVGLLVVNTPGFPVPRLASRVAGGQQLALVAAGARSFDRGLDEETAIQLAMRRIVEGISNKVRGEEGRDV
jgi:hypothetical protein